VRQQRVFVIDDSINQPGPRLIEALEKLARHIHPEAFGK
jgi:ABC-type Fe3+-hydroxamate transport system substrate-binding protein